MKKTFQFIVFATILISCSQKTTNTKINNSSPIQESSNSGSSSKLTLFDGEVKVGGLGVNDLYFGFAEGDKLIINVKEFNGRQISDVLIFHYPSDTIFKEKLVKEISNKEVSITKTGVYWFKFSNAFGEGRIYKVKIEREFTNKKMASFNSKVQWKAGFDTVWHDYPTRVVVKSDTILNTLLDEEIVIQAHSDTIKNRNKETLSFNLPNLSRGWAYYFGAGDNCKKSFMQLKNEYENSPEFKSSKIIEDGIMAKVILRNKNILNSIQCDQKVNYWLTDSKNDANNFLEGKYFTYFRDSIICSESKKMSYPSNGQISIAFLNESNKSSLAVYVNVAAITINEQYETRQVHKFRLVNAQKPYLTN